MSIKTKTLSRYEINTLQVKFVSKRNHLVSLNCFGTLSYKGGFIDVKPNKILSLPRNKTIYAFLYGNECIEINVYKYFGVNGTSSSDLIKNYLNSLIEIDEANLECHDFLRQALDEYVKLEVYKDNGYKIQTMTIVSKVEDLVKLNLRKKWSIKEVCNSVFLSESTLYRSLKVEGLSFTTLMMNIKLSHARGLLLHTRLSVSEISFESGFNSTSYFGNKFKSKYGMSPTCYRNLMGA